MWLFLFIVFVVAVIIVVNWMNQAKDEEQGRALFMETANQLAEIRAQREFEKKLNDLVTSTLPLEEAKMFLEMVGKGCTSGKLADWSQLRPSCRTILAHVANLENNLEESSDCMLPKVVEVEKCETDNPHIQTVVESLGFAPIEDVINNTLSHEVLQQRFDLAYSIFGDRIVPLSYVTVQTFKKGLLLPNATALAVGISWMRKFFQDNNYSVEFTWASEVRQCVGIKRRHTIAMGWTEFHGTDGTDQGIYIAMLMIAVRMKEYFK